MDRSRRCGGGWGETGGVTGRGRTGRRSRGVLWLAAVALGLGCGDAFERLLGPVPEEPTEVTLVDFRTGPLTEPSAFDLIGARAVRVDQTSQWDFLYFLLAAGVAELRPFEAVTGSFSEAGLQKVSTSFEATTLAPEEGYLTDEPVAVEEGDVLVVRSRRDPAFAGLRCRRFGKLEILRVEPATATLTFRHLINPNCERRGLVPGEVGPGD